jgi:hypothetical protein
LHPDNLSDLAANAKAADGAVERYLPQEYKETFAFCRRSTMARYGRKASAKVKRAMHERKRGTLRSGRSGKKVKSRKQAIAIGLSEARKEGAKVPRKKKGGRKKKSSKKK